MEQDPTKIANTPETLWVALEGENIPIPLDDQEDDSLLTDGRLVVKNLPDSLVAEQIRVLYTKLAAASLQNPSYILAVSSAVKEEGKTFTALNLALTMARDFDQNVLLLEGDLKKPSFHTYLKGEQGLGLADVLEGRALPESCWFRLCNGRLRILPAGRVTPESSRLLSSQAMLTWIERMRGQFRYIVLDTPPILPTADMNIFSQWVNGILLVVRAGKTPRSLVNRAIASLASDKIIGSILNGIEPSFSNKYYYGAYNTK